MKGKQQHIIIGSFDKATGKFEKEYYGQGEIYKNPNAFFGKTDEVCYIAELSDDTYTYKDFLEIAGGDEKMATHLFETVDWQSPHTLMAEQEEDED